MSGIKINENAVAFISDWKSRTDKHQKKFIAISVSTVIIAFIACTAIFFWFQSENNERIVQNNMNYIQDSAIQETNQVERGLNVAKSLIVNLSNQYSALIKVESHTTIKQNLELLTDKNLFDRIAFVAPDGTDTSLEGTANVSDRRYFQNAMNGKSGWECLQESRITKKPCIVFYSPVVVDDEIVGVMIGFYEQKRLNELFNYNFFNYKPNIYLLLGNGTLVASSDNETPYENLLDVLSTKKFNGDVDYEKIKELIADKERVTITFNYNDNGKTKVGTIVQFADLDMMILSVLPSETTTRMVKKANDVGKLMLASIIFIFVLVMLIMLFAFKKQKAHLEHEISLAIENLEVSVSDERKQLSVIESLADTYSGVYFIDLKKKTYQRIKELEKTAYTIPDTGIVVEGFEAYISNYVHESNKEMMGEFLKFDTFAKRIKKSGTLTAEFQRTDGGWRRGTIAKAEQDKNGEIISVVFGIQQIDSEKEAEHKAKLALEEAYGAAQLASEAKTTFLSNMSHDIRTPMNAIIGMTAIAGANIDNKEKVADCLKKITSSSKHLLGLINEVLDMSKIESGKVDLVEESFSLSDAIDNLITIHQPLIDEKHHSLVVKVLDVKHENVIGDYTRLQQVFANLLSNAIKYTPENGKLEITLTEKEVNKANIGLYEVTFKDNGIGISEEYQKVLFEPFTRSSDNRVVGIQGTGLGMPIAKNIIRMMNGDIIVKSKINEGSTFTVSFALKLDQEEDINCEKFINLPVLVVDDDEISCESTCMLLNSLEMNSEYVTSGKEAVKRTIEHHENNDDYYAIILDWRMPEMDGVETAKAIRKNVGNDIPIIILSAYEWSQIEQEAKEAGINAFLSKPLFKSRIVNLFNSLLSETKEDTLIEQTDKHDFSGKRILLVEDNEINREIAIELLDMLGVETEYAVNGKLGVEKFESSEPGYYDLIFMDIQMPVMNGYEAAQAIRALSHHDANRIPIVAMTANAFTTDVKQAYNSGMNGHIAKPIEVKQIIKCLYDNLYKD